VDQGHGLRGEVLALDRQHPAHRGRRVRLARAVDRVGEAPQAEQVGSAGGHGTSLPATADIRR
jgi:hypothetical protein